MSASVIRFPAMMDSKKLTAHYDIQYPTAHLACFVTRVCTMAGQWNMDDCNHRWIQDLFVNFLEVIIIMAEMAVV